jgi:membrane protease YdiL (CAAX protease family)
MPSEARPNSTYAASARHPWAALLFVLPMLAAYELGTHSLAADPAAVRNGADNWVRSELAGYGFGQAWAAPSLIAGVLVLRVLLGWSSRPKAVFGTLFGMLLESTLFAVTLWAVSRNFKPIMDEAGVVLNQIQFQTPPAKQMVTYLGAGIYEEALFRMGLFSICIFILRCVLMPAVIAVPLAGLLSSLAFAAAHHVGPHGEAVVAPVFLFRLMAGLFFTALYVARGFGIAVGAHAGYDLLVGVTINSAT